jgi:hypothetical protein
MACWWSPYNQPGFWLPRAAPGAEWPFRSLWIRRREVLDIALVSAPQYWEWLFALLK